MSESEEIRVLYVDDEENNLIAFKASFRRHFKVFTAISAAEAREVLAANPIHVLITDQRMPVTTGSELLKEVIHLYPHQVRILLTGFADLDALKDAVNHGKIFCYLQKPWNEEELRNTILEAYKECKTRIEKEEEAKILLKTNEQLEFYLRQKLLS